MACSGRYAESLDFASMFCVERLIAGVDAGVGAGHATITDMAGNFIAQHVVAGSPVLNVTTGVYGVVAVGGVANTQLQLTGVTFSNGNSYLVMPISANERATIEHFLNIAAGHIHMALQAANACTCTITAAGLAYLRDLNCMLAAVRHNCSCGGVALQSDMRMAYLRHVNEQLALIRDGSIELCDGYAGKDYPAFGIVERGWTDATAAQIINNRERSL